MAAARGDAAKGSGSAARVCLLHLQFLLRSKTSKMSSGGVNIVGTPLTSLDLVSGGASKQILDEPVVLLMLLAALLLLLAAKHLHASDPLLDVDLGHIRRQQTIRGLDELTVLRA
jgi:hypothetical protein